MKISEINYSKVFSLGNFENEKIGVVLSIDENEKPEDAIIQAKRLVEITSSKGQQQLNRARQVLASPGEYTGNEVSNAKELLNTYEKLTSRNFKALVE